MNIVSVEFCYNYPVPPEIIMGIDKSTTLGNFFSEISSTEVKRYLEGTNETQNPELSGNKDLDNKW